MNVFVYDGFVEHYFYHKFKKRKTIMHDALLVGKKITASYFYMAFSGILLQLFFKTPKASCDAEVSSHVGSLLSADQYGLVARFQEVAEKLKEVDGQLDSITGLFREIKDGLVV